MYEYRRRLTREVPFGPISLGGYLPIRVESMLNTHTSDTRASVEQCRRLHDAGCEIIRLTVPTEKDAENLRAIRDQLRRDGIRTPLVADIHFSARAAMKAVEFVENIRINPGNYATRKKFSNGDYTEDEYQQELLHVRQEFLPLVEKARSLGVSMRIGTNHGSLSDRIVSRRGNSPDGMVEAALEFARICEDAGYYDILFSMKSSNVRVMIQAYRLLVQRADKELLHAYPLHLGVTEAGDGDEARVKSAMGIGALLEDGLGDTIRVSLTEDPVNEVPVGFEIVRKYNTFHQVKGKKAHLPLKHLIESSGEAGRSRAATEELPFDPVSYSRRSSEPLETGGLVIGGEALPVVETALQSPLSEADGALEEALLRLRPELEAGAIRSELLTVPVAVESDLPLLRNLLGRLGPAARSVGASTAEAGLFNLLLREDLAKVRFEITEEEMLPKDLVDMIPADCFPAVEFSFVRQRSGVGVAAEVLASFAMKARARNLQRVLFSVVSSDGLYAARRLALEFRRRSIRAPVSVRFSGSDPLRLSTIIDASVQAGPLFSDGLGDMLSLQTPLSAEDEISLGFNILQGARARMSKTEFISCPGCGRTYFDLERAAASIKTRLSHLKGLKIGIMGCVVNGPGEMADADFGYVGAGKNRISLYVGKECVAENLPEVEAVDRLIDLIREHGRWVEPSAPLED
ncbi:(E)-4-hydroxy-3-methylbut-2-enyl-diphosphate synthase [Pelodictyon luteolum]|uniref:4-hydroxy-3-methylbut-2-en-1-yl diphosphate synthase (flavodoxin) n=1 Tax=Chlorobium luteolum (strain DSM 273 / BCRC 81028 / 2530) TaxID=319225 RepID=Q3B1G9_CHLL3|nr:(E)-4-hydroxy-3-methylbut-2-enyl-diphosphate synthase [Pelodictyon luteolum]ABB24812.1 4-hydroxy-3-methylbut-2-en-1-yl diphosphate synthase [Pelodictyon luteolum DSM 273]